MVTGATENGQAEWGDRSTEVGEWVSFLAVKDCLFRKGPLGDVKEVHAQVVHVCEKRALGREVALTERASPKNALVVLEE